jgi:hypothetical protein
MGLRQRRSRGQVTWGQEREVQLYMPHFLTKKERQRDSQGGVLKKKKDWYLHPFGQ